MQAGMVQTDQMRAAVDALCEVLGDGLRALYLHGSAVSGQLRPQSDIDLLAIIDQSLRDDQRRDLLAALLRISGRYPPAPGGSRCLELMLFRLADLSDNAARAEFTFGEWLRDGFEAGHTPRPTQDPEHILILAQARHQAVALCGPPASALLPDIPPRQVRQALRDALPALLGGLQQDTRNVLLTLARMWRTASSGDFVSKDAAAQWVMPQLPQHHAVTLDHARMGYLGRITDDWDGRQDDAQSLAGELAAHVTRLL
ncbi:Nucleotidyltransferase domain-containing protein [Paracoccus alcaliphilus]|uniref:Aminoglycoside (3'') (9) adenylyltransferase n=2 Tax=Paracoccus alcaliphilus TaxID=34002 RepID=A0A1H8FVA5_9RHOB|nr:aminoglycoside adenylyltransferase domain-containing protein [Paracoccus alcaliphilus]WCR20437.1 DUF4111 domain-containing protein [Paracoccus alcaliphilus]SEN35485.1 Nucleotidyltransferase domain-containing protein [Paracoccus alcaliphilus]